MRNRFGAVLAGALLLAVPAAADDIETAINEALSAYRAGDLTKTKQQLDVAGGYLAQKNAERLKAVLPAPMDGWTANDGEAQGAGAAMFGGGLSVSREYAKGDQTAKIEIMGDNPMLSLMTMMFANPQMAMASGMKLVQAGGQQAFVTQEGDVQMVIASRFFVTVSGTAPEADKLAYAGAVNFAELAKF